MQKEILTDDEGEYFTSNDLQVGAGGISMGPVFFTQEYKVRIYTGV